MLHLGYTRKIDQDVSNSFKAINEDIMSNIGESSEDVKAVKLMIAETAPKLIENEASVLLPTLINYLMKDAIASDALKSTKEKNDFFDADLRKTILSRFKYKSKSIKFSADYKVVISLLFAMLMLVIGSEISYQLHLRGIIWLVPLTVTIFISIISTQYIYKYFKKQEMAKLKHEVKSFLIEQEKDVSMWLNEAVDYFQIEFGRLVHKGKR